MAPVGLAGANRCAVHATRTVPAAPSTGLAAARPAATASLAWAGCHNHASQPAVSDNQPQLA
jgi:hypothetical protein